MSSFNDDIQGTGAVTLAGVLAACKLLNQHLKDQVVVISGAGAGGAGMGNPSLTDRKPGLMPFDAFIAQESPGLFVKE